ncbi:sulfatase-like hydrolase/transferase [Novipirellula sp. SH528]|uniref:sulfatase-like hydrolase/transferase n=1 Tax=Novipirellula sp. SH528 TaxID=3454466 RepID=UPI003F9F1D3B
MGGLAAGPLLADGSRQSYADLIKAHPSLRGYWAFEGDLSDTTGKAVGKASGGMSYVGGAVDGKALSLVPKAPVVVQNTKDLDSRSATLQLFFKLDAAPKDDEDVVIIAQAAGDKLRYKVGIKHDLSVLTYEQDLIPTSVHLPTDKPIEVGRWYHLAITSNMLDLRIYLDGQECSLVGGAFDFTHKRSLKNVKETLPMIFGASAPDGQVAAPISLDEVVYFANAISIEEIRTQLKVAGWDARMQETGMIAGRVNAKRQTHRAEKLNDMLNDPVLFERGQTRVYEGEHLGAISFPVGKPNVWLHNEEPQGKIRFAEAHQRLTDATIEFMKRQRADDKPFFIYLSHYLVHGPWSPNKEFCTADEWASVQKRKGGMNPQALPAMVRELDHHVGLVLAALKELEIENETLVIFASDNGPWLPAGSALRLSEGKYSTMEGGHRVPAMMRWPERIPAGQVNDEMVSALDILPTIAAVSGVTVPTDRKYDGFDLMPLLSGEANKSQREDFVYYNGLTLEAVRRGA